ncbi:Ground-like domain-containing protein [Caenorhabditis elegans]|uniref:Ground-like domain-containing protein n=1 Tax=Caenorhabditis elegans TaxID=6239 RepID=Q22551_CAEEL|nr:Ground-like domain-containing protein [Caenorhabditis elegans]CCD65450.1 Ground-like domain-containing protein [Caenorhabditis elegans]|eukprot:NP_001294715.1 GRounDhog (hedgehog-like family) [Caenorhabditis elegans]
MPSIRYRLVALVVFISSVYGQQGYIRHPTFQVPQQQVQQFRPAGNVYIAQPNPRVVSQYPFRSAPVVRPYVIPQQQFQRQGQSQYIQQQYRPQQQQYSQYPRFDLRPQPVRPVRPVYIASTPASRLSYTERPQTSYGDEIEDTNYLSGRLTPGPIAPVTQGYSERPPATVAPYIERPVPARPTPYIERPVPARPAPYIERPEPARPAPYIERPVPARPAPYIEPTPARPAPYIEPSTAKPQPRPQPPRTRPYVAPSTTTQRYIEPTTQRPTTRRATTKRITTTTTAAPTTPRLTTARATTPLATTSRPTTPSPTTPRATTPLATTPLATTRAPLPPSPPPRTSKRPVTQAPTTPRATTTRRPTTTTPRPTPRRTRRPKTTTAAPTTTTEEVTQGYEEEAVELPKYDETFVGQYYYGRRGEGGNNTFPLPSCFYNPSGYVCCNLMLNELMSTSFEEVKVATNLCNVHKFATKLQKHSEKIFSTQFETIVSYQDFSQKIHFKKDLVCKIEVEGRFILAYATPEDVEQEKIIPTVPSQDVQKDSDVLKQEVKSKIRQIEREL